MVPNRDLLNTGAEEHSEQNKTWTVSTGIAGFFMTAIDTLVVTTSCGPPG